MKRSLTVIIILFSISFLSSSSYAQFHLKLGPQTGMNYNIGTGSDIEETFTGFGFHLGGTADMSFTPTIGLITNIQFYDNRSASSSTEGTVQGIAYTLNNDVSLAYFLIEPLFKINIPMSGFYFVAGPAFGFSIQSSRELRITSSNNQVTFNDGSTKYKETLKNTLARFALKFGAGYDIPIGSVYLTPQAAFEYGLTNIQSDVEARVLTIQALVAVKFSLL